MSVKLGVVAACLVALALTGCGATLTPAPVDSKAQTDARYAGSDYAEIPVKLSDGRSVLCLKSMGGYGAFSCDWEHAK